MPFREDAACFWNCSSALGPPFTRQTARQRWDRDGNKLPRLREKAEPVGDHP